MAASLSAHCHRCSFPHRLFGSTPVPEADGAEQVAQHPPATAEHFTSVIGQHRIFSEKIINSK